MRTAVLAAVLGAGLVGLAGCQDHSANEAAAEANDTLDANGATGGEGAVGGTNASGGVGAAAGADGDVDVDVNLKVPEPKLEGVTVGPDGVTVNIGDDDPSVSVATNRN